MPKSIGQDKVLTTTIANASSLSGEIDVGGYGMIGIYMPDAWTAASLSFAAASVSGGSFRPIVDGAGVEVAIKASACQALGFTADDATSVTPWRFIKIRSGSVSTDADDQGAARTLTVVLKS